jgi:hypothetical protein
VDTGLAVAVAALGLAVGAAAAVRRRRRGPQPDERGADAPNVSGITDAIGRLGGSPVPLDRPIAAEDDWRRIHAHAPDAAYRDAVDQVRGRHGLAAPMLLPDRLRMTMLRDGLGFREAMIAVARDDALR